MRRLLLCSFVVMACSSACGESPTAPDAGQLPEDARVRTYHAAVKQDGPQLRVSLSGPALPDNRGDFGGRVEPGRVVFDVPWYDGEDPVLVDTLAAHVLTVDGVIRATIAPNQLTGTLSGSLRVYRALDIWALPIATCMSDNHQIVFTRE